MGNENSEKLGCSSHNKMHFKNKLIGRKKKDYTSEKTRDRHAKICEYVNMSLADRIIKNEIPNKTVKQTNKKKKHFKDGGNIKQKKAYIYIYNIRVNHALRCTRYIYISIKTQ